VARVEEGLKKALFLDRDGVIIEATPRGTYMLDPDKVVLLDGIEELLRSAREKGYLIPVVTNQPAISKGELSREELDSMHEKIQALLPGLIDVVYVCEHENKDNCSCRKPLPGMIHQAVGELEINLSQSLMVGDSCRDIKAGQAAGVSKTVFVHNEYNDGDLARCKPDEVVDKLIEIIPLL
jgi:D-glycero-D-manno-heptose 1,7-bisphosphate phosphatase